MRVGRIRLQAEQVNHIHKADVKVGGMPAQKGRSRQGFLGNDVARAGDDDIRLDTRIGAGPRPDTHTFGAVLDSLIHVEPGQVRLFVRHNDVDIVCAAQTMVGNAEHAVGIGG